MGLYTWRFSVCTHCMQIVIIAEAVRSPGFSGLIPSAHF
jgi:hypothetical protein